jgi:hypothetical protein
MNLEIEQQGLQEGVKSLNEMVEALKLKCSDSEQEELAHNYRISIYRELEKMGRHRRPITSATMASAPIAIAKNTGI